MRWIIRIALLAIIALVPLDAAMAVLGQPVPGGLGLQESGSPIKDRIHDFHTALLWIITIITIFVLGLLVYVMVKFNAKANPTPTRTTHNTTLEVLWTAIPIVILVAIAIPSFRLLYYEDRAVNPEMTLKVTGRQWYWEYEYPDHDGIRFDSRLPPENERKSGPLKLLEVDQRVIVPAGTTIRVLVAGGDVMHSFFVPSLGVQIYATPGRINETWMKVDKPGVYYGQCNQICGKDHAYMPIAVEALDKAAFDRWLVDAKKKFASDTPSSRPAAAVSIASATHTNTR